MAIDLIDRAVGPLRFRAVATERCDGDVHPRHVAEDELGRRQRSVTPVLWSMVDQVHGCRVLQVDRSASWPIAGVADVVVTRASPVAVWAADCAPLILFGRAGTIVGVHAGWRGLGAGIIDIAIAALADADDEIAATVVGPLIHPCCYEFSAPDLDLVAAGVHTTSEAVTSTTTTGAVALDVPASVRAGLGAHGVVPDAMGECTGCSDRWFSHRVRADRGRHALVAWIEPVAE